MSLAKSAKRFRDSNTLRRRGHKPRIACETQHIQRCTVDHLLQPLADFLAGNHPSGEKPFSAPRDGLGKMAKELLSPHELALCALAPLVNGIYAGWKGMDDTESVELRISLAIGRHLSEWMTVKKLVIFEHADKRTQRKTRAIGRRAVKGVKRERWEWRYFKSEWDDEALARAGNWLWRNAMEMDYFATDRRGLPAINPWYLAQFDQTRRDMILAAPVVPPRKSPPPDWANFRAEYDGISVNFVTHAKPETKAAINKAFKQSFPHADAVNHLQRVALKLDPLLIDLVERFAGDVKEYDDDGAREADRRLAINDVAQAHQCGTGPIWLPYNCDFRGRVYPISGLNFQRQDHVRSLFKFAEGLPVDRRAIEQLEIHCANCFGENKDSFAKRLGWVTKNRDKKIRAVAADPFNTSDIWREADEPFRFVAACIELAAAWKDPSGFVTHLPVSFDGSCNGVQHLALLSLDEESGRRVNLIDAGEPADIYGDIAARVRARIDADGENPKALAWQQAFNSFDERKIRKIIKRPAMTFGYGSTVRGMCDQIKEEYKEQAVGRNAPPPDPFYLARLVHRTCEDMLHGPAQVMDRLGRLSDQLTAAGKVLTWTSPSGFPCRNDYRTSKTRRINLTGGGRFRYTIGDGYKREIDSVEAHDGAAPNFVHSLDASHLAHVVNSAAAEGIRLLTVHDSFSCLAPRAERLGEIIRDELVKLYTDHDPLMDLIEQNLGELHGKTSRLIAGPLYVREPYREWMPADVQPPLYGRLDPELVRKARYSFGT